MTSAIPVPALSSTDRRQLLWFLLLALFVLAAGIGLRDPWPSDEPRFTLVAKQMVMSGDWLFPHRGSELYPDKPPMLMWLEASFYLLTRSWRVAFLLPSLLAGLLTLGLTWDLGRRLWTPRIGLFAAAALLSTFLFVFQVKRAQIDPLEMAWITLANWGLLRHCLRGPDWRSFWLGCFAAGLGVITKGVGVLALLMLLPYAYARVRGWQGVTRTSGSAWRWTMGAVAFFAAIALWLVPMLIVAKSRGTAEYTAYVNDILFHQTADRYAGNWSHSKPFWYFLPVLLLNFFPLSLAYPGAIARWWRARGAIDARWFLPLAWVVLVVFFFSLAHGKREVYVMPALPMLSLAMAPYLQDIVQSRWLRTLAFVATLIGGLALVAIAVSSSSGQVPMIQKLMTARGLDGGWSLPWMFGAIGAWLLASALWFRPGRGVQALLAGIAGLWLVVGFWAYPVLNDSSSASGVMRRTGEIIGPQAELGLVAWKEQNLLQADRPARDFGFNQAWDHQLAAALRWQAQAPDRRWLFIREKAMGECIERARAIRVGQANRRDWWVFPAAAAVPGCVPRPVAGQAEDAREDAGE